MKNLILTLMLAGAPAFAFAQTSELQNLICVNNGYRESVLQINESSLMMQDTFFRNQGIKALLNAYGKSLNQPENSLTLRAGGIFVSNQDLHCSVIGKLPMHCTSSASKATIQLRTWIRHDGPALEISDRLKLVSFSLDGALAAPGPVKISESGTTVVLTNYNVTLNAVVEYQGQPYTLAFETFFVNKPTADTNPFFSHCD